MKEKQVGVKQQAVFPGCVEPGLRGAVGGEVPEVGLPDPVRALGAFLWNLNLCLRQWEAIRSM